MKTETVHFYSRGLRLTGRLTRAAGSGAHPTLIQGPGWLGLSSSIMSRRYADSFSRAGIAYLSFDYRGFGESEGERGWIHPFEQVEDILCAITFARTRDDLDPSRIGLFGFGGTGAGNAIYAAALDEGVRCVIAQTPVADGELWLRQMRRAHEWVSFRQRLETNRRRYVLTGEDESVDPRQEIMVATPERALSQARKRDDASTSYGFHLSSAEWLLRYRPVDAVGRIAPRALLLTCVEDDAVTPADHAYSLHAHARPPKKLIRQLGVSHYEAYEKNHGIMLEHFLDWCARFMAAPGRAGEAVEEVVSIAAI